MSKKKNWDMDLPFFNSKQITSGDSIASYTQEMTRNIYLQWLSEIGMSMFEWKGLPITVNQRFLEELLFTTGKALFIKIDDTDNFAVIDSTNQGLNYANEPTSFTAVSPQVDVSGEDDIMIQNGKKYNNDNSQIIWNNVTHTPTYQPLLWFSKRLAEIVQQIQVNLNLQKYPRVWEINDPKVKQSLINMIKQVDDNSANIIMSTQGTSTLRDSVKSFDNTAPFIVDKLEIEKQNIWSEAMTFLGVNNSNINKKERVQSAEIDANNGQVQASSNRYLFTRQQACKLINKKFGLNVSVKLRDNGLEDNISEKDKSELEAGD